MVRTALARRGGRTIFVIVGILGSRCPGGSRGGCPSEPSLSGAREQSQQLFDNDLDITGLLPVFTGDGDKNLTHRRHLGHVKAVSPSVI